jgi:hypothetical protein
MLRFCTLFDIGYLTRGLVMYESLLRVCPNARLTVLAMDGSTHEILTRLNLPSIDVVSLEEFEDPELRRLRAERTHQEYCWTCTPAIIRFCLDRDQAEMCTYLDADIRFWSHPSALLDELENPGRRSVLITEHRFQDWNDASASSGRFCVQFMAFRNDPAGRRILADWESSCRAWCFARHEDGKYGDQKYLDSWPERFRDDVQILEHQGGGLAPWNAGQYDAVETNQKELSVVDRRTSVSWPVVFFHFQGLRLHSSGRAMLAAYPLSRSMRECIYRPYLSHLAAVARRYPGIENAVSKANASEPFGLFGRLKWVKRWVEGRALQW